MATSDLGRQSTGRPLHITVRFTASLPDLPLDIATPAKTTVVALKHLIRANLPATVASARLRLIYSGKILPDASILTSVIKITPPPPRAIDLSGKGKGKAEDEVVSFARTYINCSIGDDLTEEELEAEAKAATATLEKADIDTDALGKEKNDDSGQPAASTTPAPRGFDRLLTSGFTPAEVGQLRLQFMSIQAQTHTPETMPSPSTLRRMEDSWLDDNGAGQAPELLGDGNDLSGGALDDMLIGNLIGFLWPLGAIGWLIREQGVWSERRQYAIFTGFIVSLVFGSLQVL